jgi:hypothetical protein
MSKTIQVPVSLLKKMAKASEAFHELEDELEDYLISQNATLLYSLKAAGQSHLQDDLKTLSKMEDIN